MGYRCVHMPCDQWPADGTEGGSKVRPKLEREWNVVRRRTCAAVRPSFMPFTEISFIPDGKNKEDKTETQGQQLPNKSKMGIRCFSLASLTMIYICLSTALKQEIEWRKPPAATISPPLSQWQEQDWLTLSIQGKGDAWPLSQETTGKILIDHIVDPIFDYSPVDFIKLTGPPVQCLPYFFLENFLLLLLSFFFGFNLLLLFAFHSTGGCRLLMDAFAQLFWNSLKPNALNTSSSFVHLKHRLTRSSVIY